MFDPKHLKTVAILETYLDRISTVAYAKTEKEKKRNLGLFLSCTTGSPQAYVKDTRIVNFFIFTSYVDRMKFNALGSTQSIRYS